MTAAWRRVRPWVHATAWTFALLAVVSALLVGPGPVTGTLLGISLGSVLTMISARRARRGPRSGGHWHWHVTAAGGHWHWHPGAASGCPRGPCALNPTTTEETP